MSLFEDIVVICNVQSQRGLYGHFALFSAGTATIPGTLWTQLWTMDSSAKADSFAHLQKSFRKSTFQHRLKIEVHSCGQVEKVLIRKQ